MGGDGTWFAVFSFEDSGYVKDDETLDADALLRSLQDSDEPSNKERKRLGMPPLHTVGWAVPPHYDAATKRLEWGMRLRTEEQHEIVNYTIRLLGRRGIVHATLVCDPEHLDRDVAAFKQALTGYAFASGETYAEFRAGDKVAEYGLAGLVVGGAGVALVKTGLLQKFGKLIVVAFVAIAGAIKKLFAKLTGRGEAPAHG